MARGETVLHTFNRGLVSEFGLARVDVDRIAMSAARFNNWMPRSLGPMSLRPGWDYVLQSLDGDPAKYIPFVFAVDDTALLEFTDLNLRPLVNEVPITFAATGSVVLNPHWFADLANWTVTDDAGATSSWASGLRQVGTRYAYARIHQDIVPGSLIEHALEFVVTYGTVNIHVTDIASGDDLVKLTSIGRGTHVFAFTPIGNFRIEITHVGYERAYLTTCNFITGALVLTTSFPEAAIGMLRFDQSGDVVYLACSGYQQQKVIRYAPRSWGLARYEPPDGPFRGVSINHITITPDVTEGDVVLTASQPIFKAGHVGALFRIDSLGQTTHDTFTADNQFSNPVRVSGIGSARDLTLIFTGAIVATETLQRSVGEPGLWQDVNIYVNPLGTVVYNDGFDNQIIFYRIGVKAGDYTSGSDTVDVKYLSGTIAGIVRITQFVPGGLVVAGAVVSSLGSLTPTETWYEGAWSDYRGWPSSVILYEGRLGWQGKDSNWMSVSDEFESFDLDFLGDAGPINRSIGSGPVDTIHWAMGLQRLILGGGTAEHSVRSSSLDEPLTPTNYNIKPASTQGSANVDAVRVDNSGLFVQRSKQKIYELTPDTYGIDYQATDISVLVPEIGLPGIIALGVQRQPDTRVHAVRSDGTVAILVYDKAENVRAWIEQGFDADTERITGVVVLPGDGREDKVYYSVTLEDGTTHLARWAQETECRGGQINKQADLCVTYSGAPTNTIAAAHLEGRECVVWADGKVRANVTVSGGVATLGASYSNIVVGLFYRAQWQSGKLGRFATGGTTLKTRKNITALGAILAYTHADGLYYGPDFDNLDPLPKQEDQEDVDPDKVWVSYDKDAFEHDGDWEVDARLCLEARAPKPCTVLALTMTLDEHAKG